MCYCTAARCPDPLYDLGSGNAELVSREISAIRAEYRRGGGVEDVWMNGWLSQEDLGRRESGVGGGEGEIWMDDDRRDAKMDENESE